jgi:hypothetical protein
MPTKTNPIIAMLKEDHKKVKGLFEECKDANARKQQEIAGHRPSGDVSLLAILNGHPVSEST